ncbi:MAG: hypothetical protein J5372_02100 [Lachnospiraceae bacterium]|nr:hypothetical protein [Lachnospiraceae bacterium]
MRIKNILLTILLGGVISFVVLGGKYATSEEDTIAVQGELNKLFSEVEKAMIVKPDTTNNELLRNNVKYLDTYSGSYIEGNNLVVCMTSEDKIENIDLPTIKYRIVEKSYNDLLKQNEALLLKYRILYDKKDDIGDDEEILLSSIIGIGIDIKGNTLFCDIIELDEKKRNVFARLFEEFDNVELRQIDKALKDNIFG